MARRPAWQKGMTADEASNWLRKNISTYTSNYNWNNYLLFDDKNDCYRLKHNPNEYIGHVIMWEYKGDPVEVKWWKRERQEQTEMELGSIEFA